MTTITEIAPDCFRLSTYFPDFDLQFSQFLVRDQEPLLFHTGMRQLFPVVRDAVARVLDPTTIRWIGFSHFEADECGALAEWQTLAPAATPICSFVAKVVSVDDVLATRPARALADGEGFTTGRRRFRFLATPHVPHCWEAGLLFEETDRTLFCSDLFHQGGDCAPTTTDDVVARFRDTVESYQRGPLANYLPWTPHTAPTLERLAALAPRTLATMHGAAFIGDGAAALRAAAVMLGEVLGR